MIVLSVIAIAVAIRSGWPARHPSPKKLPGPRIPMTACFPCRERTVSLTFPRSTKKTTSARSPCEKIVWFFRQSLVVLPAPTIASNALGSSADFAFRFIVGLYLKALASVFANDGHRLVGGFQHLEAVLPEMLADDLTPPAGDDTLIALESVHE